MRGAPTASILPSPPDPRFRDGLAVSARAFGGRRRAPSSRPSRSWPRSFRAERSKAPVGSFPRPSAAGARTSCSCQRCERPSDPRASASSSRSGSGTRARSIRRGCPLQVSAPLRHRPRARGQSRRRRLWGRAVPEAALIGRTRAFPCPGASQRETVRFRRGCHMPMGIEEGRIVKWWLPAVMATLVWVATINEAASYDEQRCNICTSNYVCAPTGAACERHCNTAFGKGAFLNQSDCSSVCAKQAAQCQSSATYACGAWCD